ncbi:hypothetical protein Q6247_25525, partial [Klebsiella pneumoniae]
TIVEDEVLQLLDFTPLHRGDLSGSISLSSGSTSLSTSHPDLSASTSLLTIARVTVQIHPNRSKFTQLHLITILIG